MSSLSRGQYLACCETIPLPSPYAEGVRLIVELFAFDAAGHKTRKLKIKGRQIVEIEP